VTGAPVVLVVMGVAGSGKSTIGAMLAQSLGWQFQEGDSLHPAANVAKMADGIPLTDDDRCPWLERIAQWVDARLDANESGVITCSALKRSYRELINRRGSGVEFVYVQVTRAELERRMNTRVGHFMPASLLDSQLATLEEPGADEPAIRIDGGADIEAIVTEVLTELRLP
jgi:carbohydrate kinase (thermoresistant glucokinase family)